MGKKLSQKEIDDIMTASELRLNEIEDEVQSVLETSDIDTDPDARMIHDSLLAELDKITETMHNLASQIDED